MTNVYETIKKYWESSTPMNFIAEKWSYQEKRTFRYQLQDYMHGVFEFEKWANKKVLEIGCGAGIDSLEFARNGAVVTATDVTDNALKLTRALSEEAGIPVNIKRASAIALPFPDESFDCVYSFGVLHHFPDIEKALQEIRRVLTPGGTVMVMLYHRDSLLLAYSIIYLHGIAENNRDIDPEKLLSNYSERNEGCPYTRAFTIDEGTDLFRQYFSEVEASVHYNVIDTKTQRKVKIEMDNKWNLGWHLIIKARKNK